MTTWLGDLRARHHDRLRNDRHGDAAMWWAAVGSVPNLAANWSVANGVVSTSNTDGNVDTVGLTAALQSLHPWRKGPFEVLGIPIDAEWRCEQKWNRIASAVPWSGSRVLDVGCGNGYYAFRMVERGAVRVIGIDPMTRFVQQYNAVTQSIAPEHRPPIEVLVAGDNDLLPIKDDPELNDGFDIVTSMGVFYHRSDPIAHLRRLLGCLRPGGTLLLETLVAAGDETTLLLPPDRYARMRNVWYLPSVPLLHRMLSRVGLHDIRTVDVTATTSAEQRTTDWMRFQSLADSLDPEDPTRTIEGPPGALPCRHHGGVPELDSAKSTHGGGAPHEYQCDSCPADHQRSVGRSRISFKMTASRKPSGE